MNKYLIILLVSVLGYGTANAQHEHKESERNIQVTGEAEVFVVPDIIELGISLQEYKKGSTVVGITEIEQNFLRKAKKIGIEDQDIKTDQISGYQTWQNRKREGFKASKTYNVTIKNMQQMNLLLESLDDAAVSYVHIVKQEHSKEKELLAALRAEAVKDAKARAEALLSPLDASLGKVMMIIEQGSNSYYPQPHNRKMYSLSMAEDSSMPSPEMDEIRLQVQVSVVFEIK